MDVNLRLLVATALLTFVSAAAHAELVFEQTQIELNPAIGDETAVGHFKYQNKGDKQIAIKSVTTSCGCTAASAKQTADPGEKGEVTATFKIGDRIGLQQKAITVTTDDPAHPSTTLTLKVAIPTVLELQPAFAFWQTGEAPKTKTIVAKAGKDVSIKKLDVTSSSPNFAATVEPGVSPNEFKINIAPQSTNQMGAATLTIKPDIGKGQPKMFYATVRVMPPPNAATPPQTPGASPAANQSAAMLAGAQMNLGKIDACELLMNKDVEAVQKQPIRETRRSGQTTGGLAMSQCYYALPTSADSISLTVTQKGDGADARDPKQRWNEIFHQEHPKKEAEENEKEGEAAGPKKVDGIGDEAFWLGSRVGGELYVLKGNSFIRVSVGGAGDQNAKIDKCKKLAQVVLKRI